MLDPVESMWKLCMSWNQPGSTPKSPLLRVQSSPDFGHEGSGRKVMVARQLGGISTFPMTLLLLLVL